MQNRPAFTTAGRTTTSRTPPHEGSNKKKLGIGFWAATAGVLAFYGIGIVGNVQRNIESAIRQGLTDSLAAGEPTFVSSYGFGTAYSVGCVRPGYANAFKIGLDKNGNRVIADVPALREPARAIKCDGPK
jgi:hypothetical protein